MTFQAKCPGPGSFGWRCRCDWMQTGQPPTTSWACTAAFFALYTGGFSTLHPPLQGQPPPPPSPPGPSFARLASGADAGVRHQRRRHEVHPAHGGPSARGLRDGGSLSSAGRRPRRSHRMKTTHGWPRLPKANRPDLTFWFSRFGSCLVEVPKG